MHEYDVTLKMLLRGSAEKPLHALTGVAVDKWLDVELPKIQNPRVDLLGETSDGALLHLELQSSNDPDMPQRMAEYALAFISCAGNFHGKWCSTSATRPSGCFPVSRARVSRSATNSSIFAIWMANLCYPAGKWAIM